MQVDISEDTYLLAKCLRPLAESTQKDARGTNGVKKVTTISPCD